MIWVMIPVWAAFGVYAAWTLSPWKFAVWAAFAVCYLAVLG